MSTLTAPTLVPAGTFRVVEANEGSTLGSGLTYKQAQDALAFYRLRSPHLRLDIRTEWVEPTDSPSESGVPGFADVPLDDLTGHRR